MLWLRPKVTFSSALLIGKEVYSNRLLIALSQPKQKQVDLSLSILIKVCHFPPSLHFISLVPIAFFFFLSVF